MFNNALNTLNHATVSANNTAASFANALQAVATNHLVANDSTLDATSSGYAINGAMTFNNANIFLKHVSATANNPSTGGTTSALQAVDTSNIIADNSTLNATSGSNDTAVAALIFDSANLTDNGGNLNITGTGAAHTGAGNNYGTGLLNFTDTNIIVVGPTMSTIFSDTPATISCLGGACSVNGRSC